MCGGVAGGCHKEGQGGRWAEWGTLVGEGRVRGGDSGAKKSLRGRVVHASWHVACAGLGVCGNLSQFLYMGPSTQGSHPIWVAVAAPTPWVRSVGGQSVVRVYWPQESQTSTSPLAVCRRGVCPIPSCVQAVHGCGDGLECVIVCIPWPWH